MITVITPVYNTVSFLDKCISSILSQSYVGFELLLINDGSTDDSGRICDRYSQLDSRVKVIHIPHSGVSAARNIGLDQAKGEWITFVDSDDWVHEDFLKKRYELAIAEDADVAYCDVELVYDDHSEYCSVPEVDPKEETQVNRWIISRTTYSPIFFVKKALFDRYNIRYLSNVRLCEDFNLMLKVIMCATKIVHVKESLYYYNRCNLNSMMHNHLQYRDDLQTVYSDLIETFKQYGKYDLYREKMSWIILDYKLASIVNGEHSFYELKDFYPESHDYIWSNVNISIQSKLFLTLYNRRLGLLADVLLRLYNFKKNRL